MDLPRVEADGRLVEDQHRGLVDERLGQADALPEALREVAEQAAASPRSSPQRLEDAVDRVLERGRAPCP